MARGSHYITEETEIPEQRRLNLPQVTRFNTIWIIASPGPYLVITGPSLSRPGREEAQLGTKASDQSSYLA